MQKKESYKHILPHFQQPGQAYFVTWCLKDAVPAKVVEKYSKKLELLKQQIDFCQDRDRKFSTSVKSRLETANPQIRDRRFVTSVKSRLETANPTTELKKEYYSLRQQYFKAFDKYLHVQQKPKINLCKKDNLEIMQEALNFWHGKKLENEASVLCRIMFTGCLVCLKTRQKGNLFICKILCTRLNDFLQTG